MFGIGEYGKACRLLTVDSPESGRVDVETDVLATDDDRRGELRTLLDSYAVHLRRELRLSVTEGHESN